jgi:protein gp37
VAESTGIRWTSKTWNPMTGCTRVSPGCAHCYALTLAERLRGTPAFPVGFDPRWIPERLALPAKWARTAGHRIFVNSMSDVFHEAFDDDKIDQVFAVMADVDRHVYQVLTKRPERMADYTLGWLERTGRTEVPGHIWLGTSIENDRWTVRADQLRRIPVPIRFISAEPLLGPLPSLDLDGIAWIIIGGESGPGYRPMDHQWARDIVALAGANGTARFFKQSAAPRTEMGVELDGQRIEEYPDDEPFRSRWLGGRRLGQEATPGPVPESPAPAAPTLGL